MGMCASPGVRAGGGVCEGVQVCVKKCRETALKKRNIKIYQYCDYKAENIQCKGLHCIQRT